MNGYAIFCLFIWFISTCWLLLLWTFVYKFFCVCVYVYYFSWSGVGRSNSNPMFNFLRSCFIVSIVAIPFYIPTSAVWRSQFLHILNKAYISTIISLWFWFPFLWLLMMLGTFSCVYCPFAFLWWSLFQIIIISLGRKMCTLVNQIEKYLEKEKNFIPMCYYDYCDWKKDTRRNGNVYIIIYAYLYTHIYTGQEATVRTGHGTTDWFQIGKGVRQGCILSPCLFSLYAEYIMRNAGLDEAQPGIKIAGRNINNLRYADDTTLNGRKWRRAKEQLDEGERGEWKSWLKTQHSEN